MRGMEPTVETGKSQQRPLDRRIYEQELLPWLPATIIDVHVHVALPEHSGPVSEERRKINWAMELDLHQSWRQLRENYGTLFAQQQVSALVFGGVYREVDIERANEYVVAGAQDPRNRAKALLVSRPEWDAERIAQAIARGFAGIKPYPDLAPPQIARDDVGIFDFVPRAHLEMLDRLGGILMLHLPRPARLGDAQNVRDLLEIARAYSRIKLIVAHVGRAYCMPTAQQGLPHFADQPGIFFDVAANLNADVFQLALETVGADRLLFGSDLPVTMMRGMREHVGDQYINYTDGPYSWNVNRKSPDEEAKYTYYLYEELRALIRAVERAGLGREAMEKMMCANAARLLAAGDAA